MNTSWPFWSVSVFLTRSNGFFQTKTHHFVVVQPLHHMILPFLKVTWFVWGNYWLHNVHLVRWLLLWKASAAEFILLKMNFWSHLNWEAHEKIHQKNKHFWFTFYCSGKKGGTFLHFRGRQSVWKIKSYVKLLSFKNHF